MPTTVHADRRKRAAQSLVNRLPEAPDKARPDLDCLFVTGLENVRWLSGFTGSNAGMLLFADGRAIFYTDPRYTVQAKRQVDCKVKIAKNQIVPAAMADLDRSGMKLLGIEKDHFTVGQLEALNQKLPTRATVEPVAGHIEKLRMVKDEGETALIRLSVDLNSRAFEAALKRLKPGMSEAEFAAEIDYRSRKLGAERPAFDTIVAAGERSALPHAQPGAAKIDAGILLVDMGAFRDGYASDMTRMVHFGKAPARYKQAYEAVLEAQLAAIDAVRPGATALGVDRVTRRVLKAHNLDKEFVHSTGHGLGLEIHEGPRIGRRDKTKLAAGMVITIEPGVYVEGWGGIRIEDTVLVTKTGGEVLTPTPKDMREL
jgi:Xaa-Pro aminopeptidase